MEQKVWQGIVDDAAAVSGAVLAELRLRPELLDAQAGTGGGMLQAALGGSFAAGRKLREGASRRVREALHHELFPAWPLDGQLKLSRCGPGLAEALEPGRPARPELWCADLPLLVDGEPAGGLRLLVDGEPGRPLLRALRGIGQEASLHVARERARLEAQADAARLRQVNQQLAASAARMRRETERRPVMRAIGEELRKFGFESALVLTGGGGTLSLAHLSHGPAKVAQAFRLLGYRSFGELAAVQIDPERSPLLASLVQSPEPVIEVRPHALLRALFGRRATREVREKLIELFGLREVLASPLRGGGDAPLGILIAAAPQVAESDLAALADFALQASWALERCFLRERLRDAAARAPAAAVESELRQRVRSLEVEVDRLNELGKRKDNFLANVSHELRSPLVTVLGYTELLLAEKLGPVTDRQRQCLQIARGSGKRLRNFIEELLDFSRFELTREKPVTRPLDLKEVIAAAVAGYAPRLLERRLSVRQRVARGLPFALGDRDRILQVLSNLLQNAERHCPDGGRIQVRADLDGEMLRVSVQDNGSGIAPEHQERIFERLYQVGDAPQARARDGLGLGLHIVKSIVEEHGGAVSVTSALGRGATFAFTLPLAPQG